MKGAFQVISHGTYQMLPRSHDRTWYIIIRTKRMNNTKGSR